MWWRLLVKEALTEVWSTFLCPEDVDASSRLFPRRNSVFTRRVIDLPPSDQIKCFPGSGEVTDVDCVFKALYLCVTIVDTMDHELSDASFKLNGGPSFKSVQRCSAHLGECTVECMRPKAAGRPRSLEPLTLIEQDFISVNDGFERSIKVVCAPKNGDSTVSVTDATTNEPYIAPP